MPDRYKMICKDTTDYIPGGHGARAHTWFVYDYHHHLPHISKPKLVYSGSRDDCKAFVKQKKRLTA